jgi:hypothetical protein
LSFLFFCFLKFSTIPHHYFSNGYQIFAKWVWILIGMASLLDRCQRRSIYYMDSVEEHMERVAVDEEQDICKGSRFNASNSIFCRNL